MPADALAHGRALAEGRAVTDLFRPLLPGATARDRLFAGLGAALGIAVTALAATRGIGFLPPPWLVAPIGASAVLVFAVPASPLAQPWSVIGGNTVSALVGIAAARWIAQPELAAGVAVGGAILAMSALRCLHPPGGAAALTAVIGGAPVAAAGFRFALAPVAVDSVLLVAAGLIFHRWSRHSYPHRPPPAPPLLHPEDLDAALASWGEPLDVSRADLDRLVAQVAAEAARRERR